jgi:hypothetical protein
MAAIERRDRERLAFVPDVLVALASCLAELRCAWPAAQRKIWRFVLGSIRRLRGKPPVFADDQWPLCANIGHSQTVRRTGQVDPESTFKVRPLNGR